MTTLRRSLTILLIGMALVVSGCPIFEPDDPNGGGSGSGSPPAWLLTAWIWPIAANSLRTYDFTQAQAAGRRTVEIRTWQQIGAMGWQSNQGFTGDYTADGQRISIVGPTGHREEWVVLQRSAQSVQLQNQSNGSQVIWYNCSHPGWPSLVRSSMRACR